MQDHLRPGLGQLGAGLGGIGGGADELHLGVISEALPHLGEAVGRAYRRARIEAARETGLDETQFPATCPYSFDDITTRSFSR